MTIVDKKNVFERVRNGDTIELELGCGPGKRHVHALGVDQLDYPGVDLVGDVFEILTRLPAGCVTGVYTYHFLEHITDLGRLLDELSRVMKPCASLRVEVPHFSNPYYYSDPTHVRQFGLYTFCYLADCELYRRAVPKYGLSPKFSLKDVRLQFDSPFLVRKIIKRLVGPVFNLTRWLQEFHEENLCYLFPAYQIRYELQRI